MPTHETRRRWVPGRQTLSRSEPEIRESGAQDGNGDEDTAGYDPVYDWFDLRRARWIDEDLPERT